MAEKPNDIDLADMFDYAPNLLEDEESAAIPLKKEENKIEDKKPSDTKSELQQSERKLATEPIGMENDHIDI
jgi:hypothetical protein